MITPSQQKVIDRVKNNDKGYRNIEVKHNKYFVSISFDDKWTGLARTHYHILVGKRGKIEWNMASAAMCNDKKQEQIRSRLAHWDLFRFTRWHWSTI